MDLLLESGAEINALNSVGDTPLLWALRNPNCTADVIEWLLGHGASTEATNNFSRLAFPFALRHQEPQLQSGHFQVAVEERSSAGHP